MFESLNKFIRELKPGMVFYFKDVEVLENIPHYFVIINKDIQNSPVLVLPVATSQVEKRIKYYEKCDFDKRCLVIIEPNDSNNILSKKTAFDCNQVKDKAVVDLYESFVRKKASYEGTLPIGIVEKLRDGVILSNQIEKWIKELV